MFNKFSKINKKSRKLGNSDKSKKSFFDIFQKFSLANNLDGARISYYGYDDDYYDDYNSSYSNDGLNYNNNYYGDDLNQPPVKPRKKGFTWTIMGSILGSLLVGGVVAGVAVYLLNNLNASSRTNSNDTSGISTYYQKDSSQDSVDAIEYIYQRTLSVQFFYSEKGTNRGSTISGTAWIFNKDSNNHYYMATNLHVAAGATYGGKTFTENGQTVDFSNFELTATYVGFLTEDPETPLYSSTNLNMLKVANPTITYTATTDQDSTGFGKLYSSTLGINNSNFFESPYLQGAVDFSILEFDFSDISLVQANANSSLSNYGNISAFKNWLKAYDANPTQFYETAVGDLQSTKNFGKYLYMGGFPGTQNYNKTYKPSFSQNGANYLNFGQTSWISFSKFPLAVQNQKIDDSTVNLNMTSNITFGNYNQYGGTGFSSFGMSAGSGIPFFNKNSKVATEYENVGYYALLDANSLGGSSGSMLMIKDPADNQFKVIGIYWGQIEFSNGTKVGVGNFLNISGYSVTGYTTSTSSKNAPAYNIFQYANAAIKTASGSATLTNNQYLTSSKA